MEENNKLITSIISAVIVTAVLAGGIVYGMQKKRIDSLNNEIKVLEEKAKLLEEEKIIDSAIKNKKNTVVFYEEDNQIWKMNVDSTGKEKITDGSYPNVSPDNTKLAYTRNWNHFMKTIKEDLGVHIIDLESGEDTLLNRFDEDEGCCIFATVWSSDGKFLMLDTGTDVIRGKIIIDAISGEEVVDFAAEDPCEWISGNRIIFNDPQEVIPIRPWQGGQGSGIAIISLDGEKEVLKYATDLVDYRFIEMIDDKIYFSKREFNSPPEWGQQDEDNGKFSYWLMDNLGNNLEQVDETTME